jgi:hypothetical protein
MLGLLLAPSPSVARCLYYSPTVVTLVGEVSTKRMPGPPGYRSLRQGDLPETIFLLLLDDPICVYGDPDSSTNVKTHRNITEIQLMVPIGTLTDRIGERIRFTGQLSSAHSGSHRTPVVLYVESMRGG